MKQLACVAVACALSVCAADFWQTKPFTEWSAKDAQKMIENSPWARPISVAVPGENAGFTGSGRGSMGEANKRASANSDDDPLSNTRTGRSRSRDAEKTDDTAPIASAILVVRWQSALPVRQALIKIKYGSEAATSPEAKKSLEGENASYVIAVTGVGATLIAGDGETIKKGLLERTSIVVKGKDELKPTDIQFGRNGRTFEVYFVFPRKTEFSVDDKEIEFGTKFQTVAVRQKFRLKDMLVDGKLAL